MKVSECMTKNVRMVSPGDTVRQAAAVMAEADSGVVPVSANDRLVGMVTDRDIAIRGIAAGKGPDCPVQDVMTKDVKYCFDDDDVDRVAQNMADIQVRRLPVVNHDKRLVGIISLGDLSKSADGHVVGRAVSGISRPGGQHCTQAGA
jgi:CBS domain-containing protein